MHATTANTTIAMTISATTQFSGLKLKLSGDVELTKRHYWHATTTAIIASTTVTNTVTEAKGVQVKPSGDVSGMLT